MSSSSSRGTISRQLRDRPSEPPRPLQQAVYDHDAQIYRPTAAIQALAGYCSEEEPVTRNRIIQRVAAPLLPPAELNPGLDTPEKVLSSIKSSHR